MSAILAIGVANALMAALLAVGAAVVGRIAKRPALTHGLWLIVLVKLITPPLWTVHVPLPVVESSQESSELEVLELVELSEADVAALEAVTEPVVPSSVPATPTWMEQHWIEVAGGIWLAGSLGWLVSASRRIGQFRRLMHMASPAHLEVQTLADQIAARLGLMVSPEVWLTPGTISPLVWALGGPARLLVPKQLWKTLNHEQRSTLITHELAHLRRHDHWVRWIELAATAVYWWCPVLWWARRELREAEEQCCDAWVVWAWPKAAKSYATALLETLDFLAETRPAVPLAASGAGHVRQLKRRLTMILRGLTPKSLSLASRAMLLGLATLLLPLVPSLAQDAPKPKPDPSDPVKIAPGESDKQVIVVRQLNGDDVKIGDIQAHVLRIGPDDGLGDQTFVVTSSDDDDDAKKEGDKDGEAKRKLGVRVERQIRIENRPLGIRSPSPNASKEDVEALKKARAEVQSLSESLAKARAHVRELEGKVAGRGEGPQRPMRVEIRRREAGDPQVVEDKPDSQRRAIVVRKLPAPRGDDPAPEGEKPRPVRGRPLPPLAATITPAQPSNLGVMKIQAREEVKFAELERKIAELSRAVEKLAASASESKVKVEEIRGRAIQQITEAKEKAQKQAAEARGKAKEAREKAKSDKEKTKQKKEDEKDGNN